MRRLLVVLLVLFPGLLHAQLQGKARLDSMLQALPKVNKDIDKLNLLHALGYFYKTIDPDEGLKYSKQELNLATALNSAHAIAMAHSNVGLNYQYKSDLPDALEHFFTALKFFEEDKDKLNIGTSASYIAVVYQAQNNYEKALEYLLRSLAINKELKDTENVAGDYGNIGNLYMTLNNYPKALEYDFQSLGLFEQLKDKDGIAHNLGNIGNIYSAQGNIAKALEYDFKALAIFQEAGENNGISINLGNIGEAYLGIAKDTTGKIKPGSLIPAGKTANLNKAIEYLQAAITLSDSIGELENIIEFEQFLSEAYLLTGNYKAALESYKHYAVIKDSVFSTDNKVQMAKLETKRELELKDKQILIHKLAISEKRNERIIYIIGIALLLVVTVIIFRKLNAQQQSNKELSKEKKKHLARIEAQTNALTAIAYTQSHDVRGQVATILGLVNVFNISNYADPDNKIIIEGIAEATQKLDAIVQDIIRKENNLNKNSIADIDK